MGIRKFWSVALPFSKVACAVKAGSYILAGNTVEFNMPAYLGLYPSFLVL